MFLSTPFQFLFSKRSAVRKPSRCGTRGRRGTSTYWPMFSRILALAMFSFRVARCASDATFSLIEPGLTILEQRAEHRAGLGLLRGVGWRLVGEQAHPPPHAQLLREPSSSGSSSPSRASASSRRRARGAPPTKATSSSRVLSAELVKGDLEEGERARAHREPVHEGANGFGLVRVHGGGFGHARTAVSERLGGGARGACADFYGVGSRFYESPRSRRKLASSKFATRRTRRPSPGPRLAEPSHARRPSPPRQWCAMSSSGIDRKALLYAIGNVSSSV